MVFVLQDLTLKHGWRTGAIIPELRKEIKIMNTEQYIHMVAWSQALTGLIEQMQVGGGDSKNAWFFWRPFRTPGFSTGRRFHTNRFSVIPNLKLSSGSGPERGKP